MVVPQQSSNNNMTDSDSFKYKSRFTNNQDHKGIENVEIAVPYSGNLWRILEMLLINCKINLSQKIVLFAKQVGRATDIAITDKKLHFAVVTQGHKKLLEQL